MGLGPAYESHDDCVKQRAMQLVEALKAEGWSWKDTLAILVNGAGYMHNHVADVIDARNGTIRFLRDVGKAMARGRYTFKADDTASTG